MKKSATITGISVLFALASILFTAGCNQKSAQLGLQDTLMQYQRAIRWSDYIIAAEYLSVSEPEKIRAFSAIDGIKVTDYQVKTSSENEGGMAFTQLVEIQFYREPSIYQQKMYDRQNWMFDEKKQRWLLLSGLPKFLEAEAAQP